MSIELVIRGNLSFVTGGKLWINHIRDEDLAKFARFNVAITHKDACEYVVVNLSRSQIGSDPEPFASHVGKICEIRVRLRKFTFRSQYDHNYGAIIEGNALHAREISLVPPLLPPLVSTSAEEV